MLTQVEVELFLEMIKGLVNTGNLNFPGPGESKEIDIISSDGKEKFIIDINRKGRIKISKCTYQNRYRRCEILLRLDVDGPPHTNPDGQEIPGNHLHIYREGYEDKWAYPISHNNFTNVQDLINTLFDFLKYCKVNNVNQLSVQGGLFNETNWFY